MDGPTTATATATSTDDQLQFERLVRTATRSQIKDWDDGTLYRDLMSRERAVLAAVNRAVDHDATRRADGETLLSMPAHKIAMRTAAAVRGLLDDVLAARSLDDTLKAVANVQRMPFIGVALIVGALVMCVVVSA